MPVSWSTYVERLGPQGLRVVLRSLVSHEDLRALAGPLATVPESEDLAMLAIELVARDSGLGERLLGMLSERVGGEDPPPDGKSFRQTLDAALVKPDPGVGVLLHRAGRADELPLPAGELRASADVIAAALFGDESGSRPKGQAKVARDRLSLRELEQERRELEGRVRQLEGQLKRALARIEELNERRARERTGEITTALRRLTTEQRRSASGLEKLREADSERRGLLRDQTRRIDALESILDRVVEQQEAQARVMALAQSEIMRELNALRGAESGRGAGGDARRGAGGEEAPRVGLFVDVQNVFYGAREKNARVDFEALLAAAAENRQLVRAVAYLVEAKDIDQSAFIHLLQMKAYEVKRKPLRVRADRSAKGNTDLEMALDAIATADKLDVVVLVTGDGDFVPLVRELKLKGCRVEVYGFPKSTAPDLKEAADRFFTIGKRLLRPLRARKASGLR